MTEEKIRQRVSESFLKRDIGDDTSQEEMIPAYAYFVAGEDLGTIRRRRRRVAFTPSSGLKFGGSGAFIGRERYLGH